ncbi:MAG: hypothetical protein BJ554DRAFT_7531 [Olpidium bornovanus]|uniref:ATP phosphoribosyltransferase n=1 Tax=Olpidium bornovanus TaxID=278681 RepID=A0A8H7ZW94_9FUNG|nr:MAG: hypothetical protein BJ554DRAFT_7531 [Olpidium bornovanus]
MASSAEVKRCRELLGALLHLSVNTRPYIATAINILSRFMGNLAEVHWLAFKRKSLQLLAGADIQFHRKSRIDIALSSNLPIALVFLPAADIAKFVGEGNIDLGITGQDVIAEAGEDTVGNVDEVLKLGFGKCRLCLQVPVSSPYKEPRDLLGKKVATSFENLASRYFEKLGEEVAGNLPLNGVVGKCKTRVVSVSGSVEASCSLGLADGIGKAAR